MINNICLLQKTNAFQPDRYFWAAFMLHRFAGERRVSVITARVVRLAKLTAENPEMNLFAELGESSEVVYDLSAVNEICDRR
jgi:hypothetical protein